MISMPLFRQEARRSILLLVIFPGILALYASVILTMYDPELGDSLAMMKEAMPELFAAFGMSDPGSTLTEFLANYLYGFLFLVLPLVCRHTLEHGRNLFLPQPIKQRRFLYHMQILFHVLLFSLALCCKYNKFQSFSWSL